MKAYVQTRYGPPEVLRLEEVPRPEPGDHEVLVRVCATTVNRTDDGLMRADPFIARFFTGLLRPRNSIPGSEFAGEVEKTGKAVGAYKPGDKVFGFSEFGAHAEFLVMPENGSMALMPERWTFEEAAPLSEGAHYALNFIRAAGIQKDHNVMIYGPTGAIGTAAVQIVKSLEAHITAICDTARVELVKSLGADRVIDSSRDDFTGLDQRFDVIFDAVGKLSFRICKPLLKKNGIYVSTDLGYMAQNPFLALITPLTGGKRVLFPIPKNNSEIIHDLKELAEAGKLKPVIDRRYPFEELRDAYRYVRTGKKTGNVVINLNAHSTGI